MMTSPFHAGELLVQTRAGVLEQARRIGRGLHRTISPVAQDCLRSQRLVVLGSVDTDGQVWASLLTGPPGFLQAVDEHTVEIHATPLDGDPLGENLRVRPDVGLLVIDLATRRRNVCRLNVVSMPDICFRQTADPWTPQQRQQRRDRASDSSPRIQAAEARGEGHGPRRRGPCGRRT